MSVLTDTRLTTLRYTTAQFIKDDPTRITLKRQVRVSKPGGGHDFPKVDVAPQTFRLINQDIGSGFISDSDNGSVRRFNYVAVGRYNADVDINDTWSENGIQYKVDSIIPNNGWETRFYISGYANEPEHG